MISNNQLLTDTSSNWTQLPATRQKLRDRNSVRCFVQGIEGSAPGQIHVFYLNDSLDVIGAMRWSGKHTPKLADETPGIIGQGKAIGASGYILACADPGESYRPPPPIVSAVSKLRRASAALDLPLLDYLVFAGDRAVSVGGPHGKSS